MFGVAIERLAKAVISQGRGAIVDAETDADMTYGIFGPPPILASECSVSTGKKGKALMSLEVCKSSKRFLCAEWIEKGNTAGNSSSAPPPRSPIGRSETDGHEFELRLFGIFWTKQLLRVWLQRDHAECDRKLNEASNSYSMERRRALATDTAIFRGSRSSCSGETATPTGNKFRCHATIPIHRRWCQ